MQLTEADKALLAKVRRNQEVWRRRRWLLLAISSLFALASIVSWFLTLPKLLVPETFGDAMLWQSVLLTFAMVFSLTVGNVIARWENPTRDLLLRLIDSQDEKKP